MGLFKWLFSSSDNYSDYLAGTRQINQDLEAALKELRDSYNRGWMTEEDLKARCHARACQAQDERRKVAKNVGYDYDGDSGR